MKSLSLISRSYLINIDHPLSAKINKYNGMVLGELLCVRSVIRKMFLSLSFYIIAVTYAIDWRTHFVITGAFFTRWEYLQRVHLERKKFNNNLYIFKMWLMWPRVESLIHTYIQKFIVVDEILFPFALSLSLFYLQNLVRVYANARGAKST